VWSSQGADADGLAVSWLGNICCGGPRKLEDEEPLVQSFVLEQTPCWRAALGQARQKWVSLVLSVALVLASGSCGITSAIILCLRQRPGQGMFSLLLLLADPRKCARFGVQSGLEPAPSWPGEECGAGSAEILGRFWGAARCRGWRQISTTPVCSHRNTNKRSMLAVGPAGIEPEEAEGQQLAVLS
jgi:hypothetical protein